jgi:hypothetical protein
VQGQVEVGQNFTIDPQKFITVSFFGRSRMTTSSASIFLSTPSLNTTIIQILTADWAPYRFTFPTLSSISSLGSIYFTESTGNIIEIDRVVLIQNPPVSLTNGNFEANSLVGRNFKYLQPSGWSCSNTVRNISGCVIVKSSDQVWGGGGSPSGGNYYLAIQQSSAVSQTIAIPMHHTVTVMFSARSRPGYSLTGLSVYVGSDVIHQDLSDTWRFYSIEFLTVYQTSSQLFVSLSTRKQICNPSDNSLCTIEVDNIYVSANSLYTGSISQIPCPIGQFCPFNGLSYSSPCNGFYS